MCERMLNMFDKVKKNFGFGCMRLPMIGEEVDKEHFSRMIDAFMEYGFNYFDTAHGYLGGRSETALRECLVARYPRESYVLTNKLSGGYFNKEEDILPLFHQQLACCGVDYFDFYLMHAQDKKGFEKYKACRAYETALELKEAGKIKHMGISFHDKAEVLDMILCEYPQIEVVQLQFNYVDYDDASIQSKECYEVCRKHDKPVIVMEPVKGGKLAELPKDAQSVFDALGDRSPASYAIRFAAGFEGIFMVLSGMGNMDMIHDNCSYMQNFSPLSDAELAAVHKVNQILKGTDTIACTACRYCVDGCPQNIAIPNLFACLNTNKQWGGKNGHYYYTYVHTVDSGKASDCMECGQCEDVCPQHLPIRKLLKDVAAEFENQNA